LLLDEYILNILMPTSVHIPKPLLVAVDRRARQEGVSRNRFIVRVLAEEVSRVSEWSPGFFESLKAGLADRRTVDEMLAAILSRRTSKPPPQL
jgi:hypothetical protein